MVVWWAYSTLWFCQNIQNWKAQKVKFISYKLKKKEKKRTRTTRDKRLNTTIKLI